MHRGKAIICSDTMYDSIFRQRLDDHLLTCYRILRTRLDKGLLLGQGDTIRLSPSDFHSDTDIQGLVSGNQFKRILVNQPDENYDRQAIVSNARFAFSCILIGCRLDIRGLKFSPRTDVTGMLRDAIAIQVPDDYIIDTLVVTPEQYALFTSKSCINKTREIQRLLYNHNNSRRNLLKDYGDSPEFKEKLAEKEGYFQEDLALLLDREMGTFFFGGSYDNNRTDIASWEAVKKRIQIKEVGE